LRLGPRDSNEVLIGPRTAVSRRSYQAVNNGYLWKENEQLNHLSSVRYEHGHEITDLPGVTGIGMGKDHIIAYVSNLEVEVPKTLKDIAVVKVRRV